MLCSGPGLEPVFVDVESRVVAPRSAALEAALDVRSGCRRRRAGGLDLRDTAGDRSTRGLGACAARPLSRCSSIPPPASVPPMSAGERLGHQGDAEVFSFHATKPFAIGEGGLVTTSQTGARLSHAAARQLRPSTPASSNDDVGLNAKLAEWPAATALAVLDRYENVIAARRASAERILAALAPHGYVRRAARGRGVAVRPRARPVPVVRAAALEYAQSQGSSCVRTSPLPLHQMPAFSSARVVGDLCHTQHLSARILSLPMANDLSDADVDAIVECLKTAARASGKRAWATRTPDSADGAVLGLST